MEKRIRFRTRSTIRSWAVSRSCQSNQPTLNPIRERSGRPDITHDVIGVQDERKTSRSQEIDVDSFREEPGSSQRTGRPVTGKPVHETTVIQTRSSEDRKDFNVEHAHERTRRLVITHDVINVWDSSQTRSAHESDTFNVGDETLRERTERSIADHDVSHESIMVNEADMYFRIPGLPHSVVKDTQRKLRTTQIDMLFNKIYDKINHLILSVQNQKQMIEDVGNIELCELLETEPKTQCTVCLLYWNTSILNCTCVHFLYKEKGPIRNSSNIRWTFFQSVRKSSRREDLMDIDMVKSRETKNIFWLTNWRRNAKKRYFQWIHVRFLRGQEFRIRIMDNHRDEDLCWGWGALADEDHTHNLTAQEYFHYKSKWWLHSNKQGSNTILLRHGSDFKQTLSTLQRLQQEAGEEPHVPTYSYKHQQWEARSSPSTWWNWQGSRWTSYHSESQEGDAPSIEWTGRPVACNIWPASSENTFMISIYFVTDWSFTADGGLL